MNPKSDENYSPEVKPPGEPPDIPHRGGGCDAVRDGFYCKCKSYRADEADPERRCLNSSGRPWGLCQHLEKEHSQPI